MTMVEDDNSFLKGDCHRFQEILERRLVDEENSTEVERSFLRQHERECTECALFATMIRALTDFDGTLSGDEQRDIRETVQKSFTGRARRRWMAMAAAAAILLAVSAVTFTLFKGDEQEDMPFALSRGQLKLNAEDIATGDQFVFGDKVAIPVREDALIQGVDKIFVALEKESKMSMLKACPNEMTLKLDEGRMAIHLVPGSGIELEVVLPDGKVHVKGTVFVVKAKARKSAVDVLRGTVTVEKRSSRRGAPAPLTAGRSFSFERDETVDSNFDPKDNLLKLLGFNLEERSDGESQVRSADLESEPTGDEAAEGVNGEEKKGLMDHRRAEAVTPASLLQAARACRMQKDWSCAVENYTRMIKAYPNLPDAITTMVPLAQILLENLKQPEGALDYFKMYQKKRPVGGLSQEALWGECRALRTLHRKGQEQECLERYVEKYPNTTYSLMARTRLDTILQQKTPEK